MKLNFYRTFDKIGQPVILIKNSELKFEDLPDNIKSTFNDIKPIEDNVEDLSKHSVRWWLCKECESNLLSKGYYLFTISRIKN